MKQTFSWRKLGHVFVADGRYSWMKHYGQVPTAIDLGDRLRVYFSCRPDPERDGDQTSYTTFLDVDRKDPTSILYVSSVPVMPLGELGTFDQFGVMPCCVIREGNLLYLYYVGWSRSRPIPWQAAIGMAISTNNGESFDRIGQGPIISKSPNEPFVHGSPWVMKLSDGNFRMWYLSGIRWVNTDSKSESIYRLMTATSTNGINWDREGRGCIEQISEDECQARPAVVFLNGQYHMWFSSRCGVDFRNPSRGYNIGYASSHDGVLWARNDALGGLRRSQAGWDSEMISYPNIIRVDDRILCFYCGNMMGRSGFGVAEMDDSALGTSDV